ncbi:MAG: hypothetical protein ABEJ42_06330 [Halobacteriaceae archaeon]
MTDEAGDDELEELPGGGLSAPWEGGPRTDSTEGDGSDDRSRPGRDTDDGATDSGAASSDDASGESDGGPTDTAPEVSTVDRLVFLVPRFLALVVFVGIPATVAFSLFVGYFQLSGLHQVIGLLGFALLVRWALRPHLEEFFTHPADREA